MSRFDDLDQHLRREEAIRQEAEAERIRELLEARGKCIPQIGRAFKVLDEFYKTVLQSRGHKLILRQKDGPTQNELRHMHDRTILYAYVVNVFSPRSEQPYPNEAYYLPTWAEETIGEQDYHVWHPNIGLHFAGILTPKYEKGKITEDVDLSIEMRAWGKVDVGKNALALQGINVWLADGGWEHTATNVRIKPDETRLEHQVETGLRVLGPNIVHHKAAFNYRR